MLSRTSMPRTPATIEGRRLAGPERCDHHLRRSPRLVPLASEASEGTGTVAMTRTVELLLSMLFVVVVDLPWFCVLSAWIYMSQRGRPGLAISHLCAATAFAATACGIVRGVRGCDYDYLPSAWQILLVANVITMSALSAIWCVVFPICDAWEARQTDK